MTKETQPSVIATFSACIALLAGAILPCGLEGQRFEVTPFVGLYLPTHILTSASGVSGTTVITETLRQGTQFLFSGRLTYWINPQVGVEGSFSYTRSSLEFSESASGIGQVSFDTSAHLILGSARMLYGVGPQSGDPEIHLLLGVSVVARGGAAYDLLKSNGTTVSGLTNFGGVIGASVRHHIGRSLLVRLDLEDNLYSANFEIGGSSTTSQFQNDLVVGLGLVIPL